ncbi:MAG TPA: hypothetical protein ENK21_04640 [Trueperaceae bacterium]|nr:hypothetical protein [Trueperaceae bacterium]
MKKILFSLVLIFGIAFAQTGVTDTEIRIGTWGPQSGPAAAWGTVMTAMDAYFQYINDNGGVNGRNLVLVSRDDGYDPARAVSAVRELIDREKVFALVGGIGTANGLAVLPFVKRNKIPWVSPSTGSGAFAKQSDGLIYASYTNYGIESALMTRHAINELGNKKIAVFYQNDGYGKEGLEGVRSEVAKLVAQGSDAVVVSEISYERGETNMGVQALRLSTSGADALVMYSTPTAAASLLNEIQNLDYHPRILATSALLDPSLLANPGMQGALLAAFFKLPSVVVGEGNGDPVADDIYVNVVAKYAPEAAKDPFRSLAGIAFAQPLVEALKAAGPDLTRESLLEALNNLSGYDTGLFANIDFTNGYQGNNSIRLLQMTPKGLRIASDFISY